MFAEFPPFAFSLDFQVVISGSSLIFLDLSLELLQASEFPKLIGSSLKN